MKIETQITVEVEGTDRYEIQRDADREAAGEAHLAERLPRQVDLSGHLRRGGSAVTRHCPTPDKTSYATQRAAIAGAIFLSRETGKGARWYRCPCGSIHLTTKEKR